MSSVFVSHSSLDRDFVEREIITLLRRNGIETWYARDSIQTAAEWERHIRQGLRTCDWFLVVLSPNSVESDWVKSEVDWALVERRGRVIPVMLETCDPTDLHLRLRLIQHIDFRQNIEQAQDGLLALWGLDKATQVATRYRAAQEAIAKEDWAAAVGELEAVLKLDPTHAESQSKLNDTLRQKELAELYGAGLVYLREKRRREALKTFQEVLRIDSGYKNIADLIAEVNTELAKEEAAQFYSEALNTMKREDWDTAVKQLGEVLRLNPTHAEAQAALNHSGKQKELAELYKSGITALQARRWREALKSFRRVRSLERHYRDIADLIAEADAGVAEEEAQQFESEKQERAKEEAERQAQASEELHREALDAIDQEDWTTARMKLQALQAMNPQDQELTAKLVAVEHQQQLAKDYQAGLGHFKAREWAKALEQFRQIQSTAGDYKDVPRLVAQAEAEIKELAKQPDTEKHVPFDSEKATHPQQFEEGMRPARPARLLSVPGQRIRQAFKNTAVKGLAIAALVVGLLLIIAIVVKKLDSRAAADYYNQGLALYDQKSYGEAEAKLRLAVELEPNNASYRYKLGLILTNLNKVAEAEACHRKAVELDPNNAEYHYALGFDLEKQQKYAEAEAEFRKAVELDPNNARYFFALGDVLIKQQKYAEAEAEYGRAVKLEPNNALYYRAVGLSLEKRQKYTEAEASYRKAVELNPNNAEYHYALGFDLEKQKKYKEAEAEFRKAVELDPNNALYHLDLGGALSGQKKYKEAEAEDRKAIELDPNNAEYYYALGFDLEKQQKYKEAEASRRKAIELEPNNAKYHYGLGSLLNNLNRYAEAEAEFRKAVELDPNNAEYHYNLGDALSRQKKYKEAEAEERKAIELNPNDAEYHYGLGFDLEKQKKYAEARAAYKKALEVNPNYTQAREALNYLR